MNSQVKSSFVVFKHQAKVHEFQIWKQRVSSYSFKIDQLVIEEIQTQLQYFWNCGFVEGDINLLKTQYPCILNLTD